MEEGQVVPNPSPRFYCVCAFCRHHDSTPGIEFNFNENAVYYKCAHCKKMNRMSIKSEFQPYAKGRTGLR